jgi:hypothetical protein
VFFEKRKNGSRKVKRKKKIWKSKGTFKKNLFFLAKKMYEPQKHTQNNFLKKNGPRPPKTCLKY